MSACVDHPFSFPAAAAAAAALSPPLSFIFLFLRIYSRRSFFPPTTLGYARKIGNPGPHYSTVSVFISSPFSRVRLASDPSCSGLRLRRFRLGPIVCLLC